MNTDFIVFFGKKKS